MGIIIAKNKENWPNQGSFAQAWEWGEVLRAEGQEVDNLLVKEGEVVIKAQIVYKSLPFGWKYAFCPRGPIFENPKSKITISKQIQNSNVKMYKELADYLKTKKCVFLRCESEELPGEVKLLKTKDISPKVTVILDLIKNEEEILAGMKKNTRYSIRFAEKQNLIIKKENNLDIFWNLLQGTAMRDNFTTHSKVHYQYILKHPQVWQLTAYQNDMPVASAIFIGSGDTITYLFAASDYNKHQLLAPYLIQWEAIKMSKKMGYKKYDFFGIAPEDKNQNSEEKYLYDTKHQYAGITKFKLGFGGTPQISPGTFDLVLDAKKYWIYKIVHFLYGIRKIGR